MKRSTHVLMVTVECAGWIGGGECLLCRRCGCRAHKLANGLALDCRVVGAFLRRLVCLGKRGGLRIYSGSSSLSSVRYRGEGGQANACTCRPVWKRQINTGVSLWVGDGQGRRREIIVIEAEIGPWRHVPVITESWRMRAGESVGPSSRQQTMTRES